MTVEKIKELLDQYDYAYYVGKEALVSDAEYDALKAKYHELTNTDEYDYVPGGSTFDKVEHSAPILSLDKVKIIEEDKLRSELERLGGKVGIIIEPKFDGLTIVKYPDGKCITRGNGQVGEDVTANCKAIKGLQFTSTYPVRTEVLMLKSSFESINKERVKEGLKPFKNPRNAASGTLRNIDSSKVKGLVAYAYDLIGYDLQHSTALSTMADDKDVLLTPYWKFKDVDKAIEFIKSFNRDDLDYEIDGLVIKSDHAHSLEKFGMTGHHPKNAIAVKFVADEKWSKLKNIVWQVGRTGRVSPVAEFEPIELMGSTVSRATLHNEAYIKALGLDVDPFRKDVCITKANDIIPAVINTRPDGHVHTRDLTYLNIPCTCPACGESLEKVNDQLFCINSYCREKLIAKAVHMVSRDALDIRGLSEETIRKMYNYLSAENQLEDSTFAIGWGENALLDLEGFAPKSAKKLKDEMDQKCKSITLSKFLIACGMPLVGRTASKAIAKRFKTLNDLAKDIFSNKGKELLSIDGIGQELYQSLKDNYTNEVIPLLNELKDSYDTEIISEYVEQQTKLENQLTFVITGTLEKPRKYYQDLIESAGHKCSGSVSKKTHYVLAGEEAGSKLDKAKSFGIPIITTEEELKVLL